MQIIQVGVHGKSTLFAVSTQPLRFRVLQFLDARLCAGGVRQNRANCRMSLGKSGVIQKLDLALATA